MLIIPGSQTVKSFLSFRLIVFFKKFQKNPSVADFDGQKLLHFSFLINLSAI